MAQAQHSEWRESWPEFFLNLFLIGVLRMLWPRRSRSLADRRNKRLTCAHMYETVLANTERHQRCKQELRVMAKRYEALRDHMNVRVQRLAEEQRTRARERGTKWVGFDKQQMQEWFSDQDHEMMNEAEMLGMQRDAKQRNERSLAYMHHSLRQAYAKCVQQIESINLSEHISDIVRVLSKINVDNQTVASMEEALRGIEDFHEEITDMQQTMDEEAQHVQPPAQGRVSQLFLDEVLQMVAVQREDRFEVAHIA